MKGRVMLSISPIGRDFFQALDRVCRQAAQSPAGLTRRTLKGFRAKQRSFLPCGSLRQRSFHSNTFVSHRREHTLMHFAYELMALFRQSASDANGAASTRDWSSFHGPSQFVALFGAT